MAKDKRVVESSSSSDEEDERRSSGSESEKDEQEQDESVSESGSEEEEQSGEEQNDAASDEGSGEEEEEEGEDGEEEDMDVDPADRHFKPPTHFKPFKSDRLWIDGKDINPQHHELWLVRVPKNVREHSILPLLLFLILFFLRILSPLVFNRFLILRTIVSRDHPPFSLYVLLTFCLSFHFPRFSPPSSSSDTSSPVQYSSSQRSQTRASTLFSNQSFTLSISITKSLSICFKCQHISFRGDWTKGSCSDSSRKEGLLYSCCRRGIQTLPTHLPFKEVFCWYSSPPCPLLLHISVLHSLSGRGIWAFLLHPLCFLFTLSSSFPLSLSSISLLLLFPLTPF
jgi:hypothetical protein